MFAKRTGLILVLTIGILSFYNCKDDKKTITQTEVNFNKEGTLSILKNDASKIDLDIEIADTDFDIQTGLMYRSSMEKLQGMLFVFDEVKKHKFWMKNTLIPLDVIWLSQEKVVLDYATLEP